MGCCSQSNRPNESESFGSYRKIPDKTKNTTWCQYQQFSYATSEMCGWRRYMEDAMIAKCPTHDGSQISLFAIFDGHGGPQISKYLSDNLTKWLYKCPDFNKKNYAESLKNNFLKIDQYLNSQEGARQIYEIQVKLSKENRGRKVNSFSYAGSTAIIAIITSDEIHIAHTGDSKAVLIKEKQIIFQTVDHKPYHPIELERINSNGGYVERERIFGDLSVSRGFGDFHYKDHENPENQIVSPIPEVSSFKKQDVDLIIMGCDGIWEEQTNQIIEDIQSKIEKVSQKPKSLPEKLGLVLQEFLQQKIAKEAKDYNGKDNMSTILIKFTPNI